MGRGIRVPSPALLSPAVTFPPGRAAGWCGKGSMFVHLEGYQWQFSVGAGAGQLESIWLADSRALQDIKLLCKLVKLVQGSLSSGFETDFLLSRHTIFSFYINEVV